MPFFFFFCISMCKSYSGREGCSQQWRYSIEIYQSLDDAPFWRADRMRYRPGVEIALAKRWALDIFYCYQYESPKGKHIAGVEIGYSF